MSDLTEPIGTRGVLTKTSFKDKRINNSVVFLKRTAIEFLQILFGTRAKGSLHYDSDDTKTDIQITDSYATALDAINLRPTIVVLRGPLSWQGLGLGNSSIESRDMGTGDRTYNDLLVGSVSINCLSKQGVEAEQIAHLVFNSFKFFGPALRQKGFFHIRSLNIGNEALIEQDGSSAETFLVQIGLTAMIQERWALESKAARRLEGIILSNLST